MYNILSLDGGGCWSIFQLLILKEKYGDQRGHEILKNYDLVIANSGGSIVLAALAENYSLDEAINLFDQQSKREKIFSKNSFKDRFFPVDLLRWLGVDLGPKYSSVKKHEGFKELFPTIEKKQMNDLPKYIGKPSLKLVVCAFDAINNRAKFFKSYQGDNPIFDSVKLTQAIHASSNAPVQYFDFPARFKAKVSDVFYELWDGALGGFNNPVMGGVIEAFKNGVDLDEVQIVSIGTGNVTTSINEKNTFYDLKDVAVRFRRNKFKKNKAKIGYFKRTVMNQAKTILYQPPDWANYVCMMFLKKNNTSDISNRFVRLSPLIHEYEEMDSDTKHLTNKLFQLDMDLTEDSDFRVLKDCFEAYREGKILNQPVAFQIDRQNNIQNATGSLSFNEAMKAWNRFE